MTYKADSITVRSIMDQFIKNDVIREKLRYICANKRNDWEKWLQMELEFFMSDLDGIMVDREIPATPDNRKLKDQYSMYIDLVFRKKRTRRNSYIFLELKCTKDVQALINGFNRDANKIYAIRECMYDTRSYWCVGFHKNCTDKSLNKIRKFVSGHQHGYHEVIKLCDCPEDYECECEDNKIGFAVI